jgi:GTP-binding protein Era
VAKERPEKVVFVLNKSDRKPFFESMFRELWQGDCDVRWVTASSLSDEGAGPVLDALFSMAEEGELLFPDDVVTDYPRRMAMADSIREKYLARMHQEVPHELGVLVKEISEGPGRWDVKADVLVNRVSQKPIVIGCKAETIKYVRKFAERELSDIFGVKVALELWVRVEPNWMKNDRLLVEMGYLGGEI